jgi:hypothetical protein
MHSSSSPVDPSDHPLLPSGCLTAADLEPYGLTPADVRRRCPLAVGLSPHGCDKGGFRALGPTGAPRLSAASRGVPQISARLRCVGRCDQEVLYGSRAISRALTVARQR